jgi:purine catabolism regulator
MGNVANDAAPAERVLTGAVPGSGAPVSEAHAAQRRVRDLLRLPALEGARVVAGHSGLDRTVRSANVMEVPDIVRWVRPGGLLLTTGYPLRTAVEQLPPLVSALAERGVPALAVKLHRYLDALPDGMLAEADRAGLPLIVLPDDTSFDDVLTAVFTSVVSERASLLERGETVHRRLVDVVLGGGDVAGVIAALAAMFDAVVSVTTVDGRVLHEAGDAVRRAAVRACEAFHPGGRYATERHAPGVHRVPDLPGSHAVVALRGGSIDHGRLLFFDADRDLDAGDLAVLERAATVAAMSMSKQLAVTAVESKYRGDFLRDVLDGTAGTAEEVRAHAETFGWDLSGPLVAVVAAVDGPQGTASRYDGPLAQERFAAAWRTVLGRHAPDAAVVGFAAEVVALLPVGDTGRARAAVRDAVREVAGDGGGGRRRFATGVSRVVSGVDEASAAYQQARRALQVGRRMRGPGAVSHFDDLGVFRLLSLIEDPAELETFVVETLKAVAGPDQESADLRATLELLLETNGNVAETARRLHFHYNTLRYRIAKLERLIGPFTTDPHLRLDLALALRIVALRTG